MPRPVAFDPGTSGVSCCITESVSLVYSIDKCFWHSLSNGWWCMTHEPSPGQGQPDQDPLSGGPAAERDRPAAPDRFVNGAASQPARQPAEWQRPDRPQAAAGPQPPAGPTSGVDRDQPDAEDDWDQDAALDALVAAVQAGRVAIPPDDEDNSPGKGSASAAAEPAAASECIDAGFLPRDAGSGPAARRRPAADPLPGLRPAACWIAVCPVRRSPGPWMRRPGAIVVMPVWMMIS